MPVPGFEAASGAAAAAASASAAANAAATGRYATNTRSL